MRREGETVGRVGREENGSIDCSRVADDDLLQV